MGRSLVVALTPEEVLKLKKAGVSDETIQLMLEQEHDRRIPSDMVEQGYATDRIGTWKLYDGRTITSTGKRQLPLHYPTEYPPSAPYTPNVYPYVVTPPINGWSTAPSSPSSPKGAGAPSRTPSFPPP
jgi:hypothetical protein